MLSSLQIENVAVIQKADVHFEKGLNVLTGETGAGKSILIDSINAILGNRTSKDLVRTGAAKAVIRAAFDDVPGAVLDSLEKAGYERSDALTLSREITAEGKSTCRINGMPATAAILRELCGGLININGQHDSVGLLNPAHHEGILDAYAQNGAAFQAYYTVYRELIKVKKELDAIITDETEKQRKIDLLSYQVQEIEDAALTEGEEETLNARRKVLANASTIRERISQCYALLSGDDETPGAVDLLGEASNAIDAAAQVDNTLSDAAGQLLDLYYTAKDVSADLIGRLDGYDTNDAELDEIEQRIDLIYKLKRKYGDTVEDIIAFGKAAREELDRIQFSQERAEHLQAEKHRLYVLARDKAEVLTQTRLRAFEELNRRIGELGGLIQRPYTPTPLAYMMNRERNDRPVKPIINAAGAEMLVNAIVGALTADYVHDARKLMEHPNDDNSRRELRETEDFIHTTLFARLIQSDIEADEIIYGMRQNVFDKKFKCYKPYKEENSLRKKIEQERKKEYTKRGKRAK